jgi:DNA-binding NtrC family response regulator
MSACRSDSCATSQIEPARSAATNAAGDLERRLRQHTETAAKVYKAALVQLHEQEAGNVAVAGRRLRISRNRVRELLVAAGHLEPHTNGRRKPPPGDSASTPQAAT